MTPSTTPTTAYGYVGWLGPLPALFQHVFVQHRKGGPAAFPHCVPPFLQAQLDPAHAGDPPSSMQAFVCGMAAGMLAKLGTHPLDVAKKRFQVAGLQRSTRYGQVHLEMGFAGSMQHFARFS